MSLLSPLWRGRYKRDLKKRGPVSSGRPFHHSFLSDILGDEQQLLVVQKTHKLGQGKKKEKRKPQVNIIQIFKCLHVCKNNLFFRGIWPNDMFVLHTLHYYVAIVCSGSCRALSHSWGISAYVCSASLLGHTSARSLNSLLSPPSRGNAMANDCSRHGWVFKMETICVLYGTGQRGSVSLTRQAAVLSESDEMIMCVCVSVPRSLGVLMI